MFLLWKAPARSTRCWRARTGPHRRGASTFAAIIVQIVIIDLVFSLDSIITAVGMVDEIEVMVAAVVARWC